MFKQVVRWTPARRRCSHGFCHCLTERARFALVLIRHNQVALFYSELLSFFWFIVVQVIKWRLLRFIWEQGGCRFCLFGQLSVHLQYLFSIFSVILSYCPFFLVHCVSGNQVNCRLLWLFKRKLAWGPSFFGDCQWVCSILSVSFQLFWVIAFLMVQCGSGPGAQVIKWTRLYNYLRTSWLEILPFSMNAVGLQYLFSYCSVSVSISSEIGPQCILLYPIVGHWEILLTGCENYSICPVCAAQLLDFILLFKITSAFSQGVFLLSRVLNGLINICLTSIWLWLSFLVFLVIIHLS